LTIGNCSRAEGRRSIAIGYNSIACQGVNVVIIGSSSYGADSSVMVGDNNLSGSGSTIGIGVGNRPLGNRAINVGANNITCNQVGSADSLILGQCNTSDAECSQIVGLRSQVFSCASTVIGNCNCVCTSSTFSGAWGNCNTICKPGAFAIGCGITSVVASHVHLPNLFLTAATGPYASDACFYAAGGTAGQAYLLCVGSDSYLTIGGYN